MLDNLFTAMPGVSPRYLANLSLNKPKDKTPCTIYYYEVCEQLKYIVGKKKHSFNLSNNNQTEFPVN